MRHRLAASLLQWQTGLGSVQGLYLALLIDAQNQRVLRRVQMQTDDCFQLTGKLRIATYLEGLDQVWLESVRVPDGLRCTTQRVTSLKIKAAPVRSRRMSARSLSDEDCRMRKQRPSGSRGSTAGARETSARTAVHIAWGCVSNGR
jgi:hypothetical protein